MESTKLSARVTAYRDAIRAARDAGVTWAQLATLFGADSKYFAAVCKAMDAGRYKPCEQRPLPEPEGRVGVAKGRANATANTTTAADSCTDAQEPKRALQRVGGGSQKTDAEMSAADRVLASIPHI